MAGRIGCIGFVALIIAFLCQRGDRWEVGALGMPEPIIDAQGRYLNGSAVDPVNRALVESGCYQQAIWCLAIVVSGICLLAVREAVQVHRLRREYREALDKLHSLGRKP